MSDLSPYILISAGGILGANARYLISTWVANRSGVIFPFGTFVINASGSFLMGLFLTVIANRFGHNPDATFLVATGFLGAYTTFSTFTYETVALLRLAAIWPAVVNALGSVATGTLGAALGILIATALEHRL